MRRNLLLGVLFCLLVPVAVTAAQDSQPTPTSFSEADTSVATLAELGVSERVLRGPVATTKFNIDIPANWEIEPEAAFQVNLSAFIAEELDPLAYRDITVEFYFNDHLLETITITESGDQTQNVSLPPEIFDSAGNNGRHEISLTLTSLHDCDSGNETVVVLQPTSQLALPHKIVPLEADLTQFPYPIYQGSFLPEHAMIVLPQSPTAKELQAAMNIAAGLGSLTGDGLLLDVTTEDMLTDEMRSQSHLFAVGLADNLTMLEAVDFPLSDVELNTLSGTAENDGLLRMAVSPWNDSKLIMHVGGFSDAGIVKASQAVSTGSLRPYFQNSISIVSGVRTEPYHEATTAVDRSLADLGYNTNTVTSRRADSASFQFYVSPDQALTKEAFLDLLFTHSRLPNNDGSNLTISVNNQPIGSVGLSDETAELNSQRFSIPKSIIHSGMNQLDVAANFDPPAHCTNLNQEGAWLTILPDSMLHIPANSTDETKVEMVSLQAFPQPFASSPTLDNTTFVLPPDDLAVWQVALQLAFEMGRKANISLSDLAVSFGDDVDQSRHLVVLGIPGETTIIQQLTDAMPLPFAAGTNEPVENNELPLEFRVPETADVGYLELFRTPWNENLLALTVLGNSHKGLEQATSALIDPQARNQLWGNVAIADATELFMANSFPNTSQESPPPTQLSEVEDGTETVVPALFSSWILPALFVSSAIMLIIIVVVALQSYRHRSVGRRKS